MSYLRLSPTSFPIERPTSNRISYDYADMHLVFDPQPRQTYDNFRTPLSATYRQLTELLRQDDDGRDAPKANVLSVLNSMKRIKRVYEDVRLLGKSWTEPLVSVDEFGDVVFEWWHGGRKITVYVTPTSSEYIKVSGPNMHLDMEDGELETKRDHQDLWRWLTSVD